MKVFVSIPNYSEVKNTFISQRVRMYLEDHFDVVYSPLERQLELEEISEYAKDADIIMTGWGHPRLNAESFLYTLNRSRD